MRNHLDLKIHKEKISKGNRSSLDFSKRTGLQVFFFSHGQSKKVATLWKSFGASEIILKNLDKELSELQKSPLPSFKKVDVTLRADLHLITILTPVIFDAKDAQTFLRKTLGGFVEHAVLKSWQVELSSLPAKQQDAWLDWICALPILQAWSPTKFGKKSKEKNNPVFLEIHFSTRRTESEIKKISIRAKHLAEANNQIRTLAELPSNELGPRQYRDYIQKRAKELKYTYEFLNIKDLQKRQAGGFLAVVQADPDTASGIAHLSYKPNKKSKKVVLVGKGLCFDTGGYNIKTGSYMYSMHRDMTGSAVALSLFEFLVQQKVQVEVHAYLAIAENLISKSAYRPNDVVITSNGTSIEVVDTDAEGRMVLSDTLAIASLQKADLMIDYATLTGAAVRSVGTERSAVFSNHKKLLEQSVDAGYISGEKVWSFPIGEEYQETIKSDIADLLQCSNSPGPDHILAATFLNHFVDAKIPWLHVDLSCEENKGGLGLVGSSVTGFGTRLSLEVINQFLRLKI